MIIKKKTTKSDPLPSHTFTHLDKLLLQCNLVSEREKNIIEKKFIILIFINIETEKTFVVEEKKKR